MNGKIDMQGGTKTAEFSPTFVRVLIASTVAVLLIVFGPGAANRNAPGIQSSIVASAPVVAGGINVAYAIEEFQGNELEQVPHSTHFVVAGILVFDFVLIPGGFLLLWRHTLRRRAEDPDNAHDTPREKWGRGLLTALGVLLVYVCLKNAAPAITAPAVFRTMVLDNTLDQNRTRVIEQLTEIGFNAIQYFHLPQTMGGGGHSFRSRTDPSGKGLVSLTDLRMPAETEVGSYSIKGLKSDTLLVLLGKGKVRMSDGTLPEYEFRVTPTTYAPVKIN